jgi:ABC-type dipeptide/oligopeptide/nickel transport system ATPase component
LIAPLLAIRNLTVQFRVDSGWVTAIDDVSLDVDAGDCVGIVGESGSGKSVTALSIMGMIRWPGTIAGGEILFHGEDLTKKSESELQHLRGRILHRTLQPAVKETEVGLDQSQQAQPRLESQPQPESPLSPAHPSSDRS